MKLNFEINYRVEESLSSLETIRKVFEALTELRKQGLVTITINPEKKTIKIPVTMEDISKIVCNYYQVPIEKLSSPCRKRELVQVRQISHYFSKSHTKLSLATIGASIGNKDHATVLHSCKTVSNLIETDKTFRQEIEEIERMFN